MDDFRVIARTKEELQRLLKEVDRWMGDLRLELNEKTGIFPLRNGIDFLGFHTYLTETGGVVQKLRREMTGAQSLLCEMLSCGSADLEILDRIGYGWDEILDQMDWPREGLDFNDVLRAAVSVGIINIKEAISERTFLLEATQGIHGKLEPEEAEELEALRDLHPDDDIEGDFNFLATHVWFKSNGPAYRRYLPEAVDNFEDNVGFFLTGGEGDD